MEKNPISVFFTIKTCLNPLVINDKSLFSLVTRFNQITSALILRKYLIILELKHFLFNRLDKSFTVFFIFYYQNAFTFTVLLLLQVQSHHYSVEKLFFSHLYLSSCANNIMNVSISLTSRYNNRRGQRDIRPILIFTRSTSIMSLCLATWL